MRYITGGIAMGAALALGGGLLAAGTTTASAAPAPVPAAQTQSLYASSALVLTVGHGANSTEASVDRAVTLTCFPKATGSHPDAKGACASLRAAGGDFEKVTTIKSGTACTKEWNPSVVTADGVWEGKRIHFERTFANPCEAKAGKGTLFEF
ncbi:subtilase-type protease inhibitor [Streptomyces hiroshimensis]|uniref:Probable subtilase-type protease inhibitor n=1 Tax=Streptomyces hiroshimensis TaxID=66424 RepID=A0ABQ2Z096_9ACTN|nr:subtilase-type protease inhibitor [Streptomyces hiroshimensis]GGY00552.1 subtilase-type protease inhibitor [Streptomyces hiroshimensis]